MFDSRDDRPVLPGRHGAGHAGRHDFVEPGKGDWINYGTPKARQLATPAAGRKAIAEGVTEYFDTLEAEAFEAFVAECEAEYAFHHEFTTA